MSDNEKKVLIVIALVAAVFLFYYWGKNKTTVVSSTTTTTTEENPSAPAAVSLPDPVSMAASVSAQVPDVSIPVAIPAPSASFVAGVTSPETQNAGAAAPAPVPMPTIVRSFINSWGPNSQALWNNIINTVPSSQLTTLYANLAIAIPLWSTGSAVPATQTNQINAFFKTYGFGSLTS